MAQARKYAFATEFSADGAILREAAKALTPEQIEAKCAAAYESGKADALAEAERRAAAALEELARAAADVTARLGAEGRTMREEAARVAFAAARKIAGGALEHFGAERAAGAIEAAMDALRHQPRLLVRLAPETAEALTPRVEAMCKAHAYENIVHLRADTSLKSGAVSIDWSDGVAHLDADDIAERVGALIDAALAAPASEET